MKINFVLPAVNRAGGTRVIVLYAEKLSELGHEVKLFSAQNNKPSLKHWATAAKNLTLPKKWTISNPSYLDFSPVEHQVVSHQGPVLESDLPDADIVIATWWETAYWVSQLPESKGAKIYFMQDYGAKGQELEKIAPTWNLPLHIITIHSNLAKLVQKHAGKKHIDVICNSIDLKLFNSAKRTKNNATTFGFAYRPLKSKGLDIIIKAFNIAQKEHPEIKLVAYGLSAVMPEFPLPEQVKYYLKPTDADLAKIYSSCDVWIFPSRIEGFGLPILEAMACRTPVIGTPAGAAPDLITAKSGHLLNSFSENEMADAIIAMAKLDQQEWLALSNSSFESISAYSWNDAAAYFEQALFRVVNMPASLSQKNTRI